MSTQALNWAWRQTGIGKGPKFLLVAIADLSSKSGVSFAGRKTYAEACEATPSWVTDGLKKLEDRKLIARVERRRKNGSKTSDFIVLAPLSDDRGDMIDHPQDEEVMEDVMFLARGGSGQEIQPKVSVPPQVGKRGGPEPLEEPENPPTPKIPKFALGGKRATAEEWDALRAIVESFNETFGTHYEPTTEYWFKMVLRQIRDNPSLALKDFGRTIAYVKAHPWFKENGKKPGLGVVFSPKVFAENVENGRSFKVRAAGSTGNALRDEMRRMMEED